VWDAESGEGLLVWGQPKAAVPANAWPLPV